MKKQINIAIVGLGQIGNYLYNELNKKKSDIEIKTGKKIKIIAISAKNKNKKRKFKINKKIFFQNPLDIINKYKVDILFEAIGNSDGKIQTEYVNSLTLVDPLKKGLERDM